MSEDYFSRAEMRWMSVEDATIEVPARWLVERGREIERYREALREIAGLSPFNSPDGSGSVVSAPAIARAALASEGEGP